jgi:hypothetical protein
MIICSLARITNQSSRSKDLVSYFMKISNSWKSSMQRIYTSVLRGEKVVFISFREKFPKKKRKALKMLT